MRYIIAIFLCALGTWAIWFSNENRGALNPDKPVVVKGKESEFEAPGGLDDGAQELEKLGVPAISDPLSLSIHTILTRLISGEVGSDKREALEADLLQAMSAEGLGDDTTLNNAARATIDRILRESEKARDAGATGGTMTPMQEAAMVSVAGKLSGSIRRALKNAGDGQAHEKALLTVDFDFDVPKGYAKAGWDVLGGFRYVEGMKLPTSVQALNGQKVGLAGYMMALGEFEDIHIFAVVESQWSCCFGMPPDIHQIVEVTMPDTDPGVELVIEPILVLGTLEVGEVVEDGWVVSVYRLKADSVDVLE